MRKVLIILFLLVSLVGFSQTKITAPLVRNFPTDTTYWMVQDSLLKGGYMVFTHITNRNALPNSQRRIGLLCFVTDSSVFYQLRGGIDNGNWLQVLDSTGGGGSGTVNFANQGTSLSGDTVQLGGSLYKNATITTDDFGLSLSSSSIGIPLQSSSAGNIAFAATTQTGAYAGSFYTNPVAANTVAPILRLYNTGTGVGANGIGGSLDFALQATSGNVVSNQLISSLTTATALSETSTFSIKGVSAGTASTLLTLNGDGGLQLNKYTTGAFLGTPDYILGTDASGNVIQSSVPTANIILDSVVIVFDGLSSETTFALTRPNTGFKNLEIAAEESDAGGFAQSFNQAEGILDWQVAIKGSKKFYITYYY